MRNFFGRGEFVWWVGVVEDRGDPVQMGRVRVRCMGYHSEDKNQIPTEDLPWAMVTNGIQSASASGLGFSPTGLVEGSWVIGFFMDGDRAQEPIIIGSLVGVPTNFSDSFKGFNDPSDRIPRWIGETDVNWAARANRCEEHNARIVKDNARANDSGTEIVYPCARPPKITSVAPDRAESYYGFKSWKETPAAGGSISVYPNNHVFETEGGHLQEFDDSTNRYHRYHPTGGYEEILSTGERTIKVIGDDHEIVIKGKNMYIRGDWNVTVQGTKRELIKGDYHLEVEGEMSMDFKKSWQTKVGHNQETEIIHNRAMSIGKNDYKSVIKGDQIYNVVTGEKVENIKRDYTLNVNEDYALTTFGNTQIFATGDYKQTNLGGSTITSKGSMTKQTQGSVSEIVEGSQTLQITGDISETVGGGQTITVTGDFGVTAARIDLN
jgi:hypothetical protein